MTTKVSTTMINQTGNVSFTGSNVSFGAIGNLHVSGGSNGQFITTVGNTYSLGNATQSSIT
jgi:hypothetical protein